MKAKIFFLSFITLIVLLPTIFFNYDHDVYSFIDNKMLTELDFISRDNVEDYINDRIGFRKEMIFIFNKINKTLFNYSSNPKYIYSDNGKEIYNKVEFEDVTDTYFNSFANAIININDYLKKNDISFYYVISPSKASIYPDNLPSYYNFSNKQILDFQNSIIDKGINCIDLYSTLKKESINNRVFNKEYDVFHWNDYGLFVGTNAILNRIHEDYSNVIENNRNDFIIETVKGKDILKKEYEINEDVDFYKLKNNYQDLSKQYFNQLDLYEDFQEFYYIKTENIDKPKILMFGGSYFISENRYEPLSNQSSEFILIHNYNNVFNIKKYVDMFKPDIVIFDSCEYTFKEYYFSEYYMNNMNLD